MHKDQLGNKTPYIGFEYHQCREGTIIWELSWERDRNEVILILFSGMIIDNDMNYELILTSILT